jgi:hypothetical protein
MLHPFGQAKFAYGGSILSLRQFLPLPQVLQNLMLVAKKIVKYDSKINYINLKQRNRL